MYHTSGFQLVIVWGYLCKLQYVYILTYCPKLTTSIILLQYNYFPKHFIRITYNLPIAQLYKDTNLFYTTSDPEAEQTSYSMDTRGFFFGSTAATPSPGYSPPSSADVNIWTFTSSPHYTFAAYPGMALTLP